MELIFFPDEDLSEADTVVGVAGLRAGGVDLVPDFETTGREGLEAGVDERGAGLTGVEDLAGAALGLEEGSSAALDVVGVEERVGLDFPEARPVGVAALQTDDEDKGFLLTAVQHSTLDNVDELSLAEAVIVTSSCRKRRITRNSEP